MTLLTQLVKPSKDLKWDYNIMFMDYHNNKKNNLKKKNKQQKNNLKKKNEYERIRNNSYIFESMNTIFRLSLN